MGGQQATQEPTTTTTTKQEEDPVQMAAHDAMLSTEKRNPQLANIASQLVANMSKATIPEKMLAVVRWANDAFIAARDGELPTNPPATSNARAGTTPHFDATLTQEQARQEQIGVAGLTGGIWGTWMKVRDLITQLATDPEHAHPTRMALAIEELMPEVDKLDQLVKASHAQVPQLDSIEAAAVELTELLTALRASIASTGLGYAR
jgi:hypothetical protein